MDTDWQRYGDFHCNDHYVDIAGLDGDADVNVLVIGTAVSNHYPGRRAGRRRKEEEIVVAC